MFYSNFERLCSLRHTNPSSVAKAIGKGASTPASWKKNGTVPKKPVLEALAHELNCSPSDFFRNEKGILVDEVIYRSIMDEENDGVNIPADGNISEFIKIYNTCNARQKHQLMEFIFDFEDKVLNKQQDFC